ncbi:MAG: twin-arginine translocation pathway signal, partial [Rhodopirellula sp.]|nr:twin-arginine translocation pathway signal [Rhodopirellula sp.]
MTSLSRRTALKLAAASTALLAARDASDPTTKAADGPQAGSVVGKWSTTHDRVWLGEEFWANPMENWRIVDGAAECQSTGGDRNVHLITHQVTNLAGSFEMSVDIDEVEAAKVGGGAGFRIGIRSEINEYRSNSFAKNGINAGLIGGSLVLGPKKQTIRDGVAPKNFALHLTGKAADGGRYELTLTAADKAGVELASVSYNVQAQAVLGNVALVNNFDPEKGKARGGRYQFRNWAVSGDAFTITPEQKFGPLLWSMYTLSDSRSNEGFVLKINALTGPLGDKDNQHVELQIQKGGEWRSLGKAKLDPEAWTATFRISNWDEKSETPYRLVYQESGTDGSQTESDW